MAIALDDYGRLRADLYRTGHGKEEMKALPVLPNKSQLHGVFNVLDDFWESNRSTLLTQMRSAYGQSISVALAKKICVAWLNFKMRQGG